MFTAFRSLCALALVAVASCAESNAPNPEPLALPEAATELGAIYFEGGRDGDPPPPPLDTLSRASGTADESFSLFGASLASSAAVSYNILHRATFTSDVEGTMGWIAWGRAPQPKGTLIEGYAEVYFGKDYLSGKGVVRITDARGSLAIDFGKHLDTKNGYINTACKAEKGGACATLFYRGASYLPAGSKVVLRASGRLEVGVTQ